MQAFKEQLKKGKKKVEKYGRRQAEKVLQVRVVTCPGLDLLVLAVALKQTLRPRSHYPLLAPPSPLPPPAQTETWSAYFQQ